MFTRRKLSTFELRCIAADAACGTSTIEAYVRDRASVRPRVGARIERAINRLMKA
jgi:hypothetical protein